MVDSIDSQLEFKGVIYKEDAPKSFEEVVEKTDMTGLVALRFGGWEISKDKGIVASNQPETLVKMRKKKNG